MSHCAMTHPCTCMPPQGPGCASHSVFFCLLFSHRRTYLPCHHAPHVPPGLSRAQHATGGPVKPLQEWANQVRPMFSSCIWYTLFGGIAWFGLKRVMNLGVSPSDHDDRAGPGPRARET
ncbi:uncharacterized protein VDAG_09410 [Verticillium dahliae VdLs.17]|uniref:Uncharacterized protein n=1 Tax=Verticillium dahliae (strain VdLs.17 / ATCC MYA-4575 / FGSC 10137) TaxID=498257 RepID=G2XGX8_VERDV|nr:uncharacterized protein VDAG_09410 [Verticillium dahliae VdLs.17]EGY19076.1 hypothetical protein VDAG_09410 [Verticillium dahliae VdLs.17]KAH6693094.1 hypothetical protein EV126DRAFT_444742 [Verticillium dahliae]